MVSDMDAIPEDDWQTLMGERAEEAAKPKTLSNAKAPKPGQGIPQSVAGQSLDPEFLAETMGCAEEVEPAIVEDKGDYVWRGLEK